MSQHAQIGSEPLEGWSQVPALWQFEWAAPTAGSGSQMPDVWIPSVKATRIARNKGPTWFMGRTFASGFAESDRAPLYGLLLEPCPPIIP